VLVVDSATPRGFGQTCSPGEAANTAWQERPKDAYAALLFLQEQPFVQADRVALMGWSQGGGAALIAINERTSGRVASVGIPAVSRLKHDFRAAVAFYPGACSEQFQALTYPPGERTGWTSRVPLLVLFGDADVWTELAPCEKFLAAAKARGNPIELKIYPGAVHAFDAPNLKRIELPQYRGPDGRVPVLETDAEARADAFVRVPAFLAERLGR
jgi:dienelactone hydrolase